MEPTIYRPKLRRGKSAIGAAASSAPTWLLHTELDEPLDDLGFVSAA